MNRFLPAFLLMTLLVSGCSFFGSQYPDINRFKSSTFINPFFSIPPENQKDYQDRSWILLAESKSKNWYYDPYSIYEEEDYIVSFDAFIVERGYDGILSDFNASSVGPFKQKIDCFGNYQWSEIFYAEHMPNQETYKNPLRPAQEWGWIKIKPKTSMAYIRARVCGRKFLDEKNINYFLYQEGKLPFIKEVAKPPKIPPAKDSAEAWVAQFRVDSSKGDDKTVEFPEKATSAVPIFYEVINNEYKILDVKKNIRQMKLSSYNMDKVFSKRDELVFQANCSAKTYSLAVVGKSAKTEMLSSVKNDLPNVAFNRACGDHGGYMKSLGK